MSDYFIFGGIDTRNFEGISVYFKSVDAVPNRVYEEVEIPHRNGKFYIDNGRYEDVHHVYSVIAMTKAAEDALVNALASKVGYRRLEDSFNPNEYYDAILDANINPKIVPERNKNTFDVSFTRKPQRFLTSGETATAVASGGSITNPTLFDALPMLQVKGYGGITIGGYSFMINNAPLGNIQLAPAINCGAYNSYIQNKWSTQFLSSMTADGDPITLQGFKLTFEITASKNIDSSQPITITPSGGLTVGYAVAGLKDPRTIVVDIAVDDASFTAGTTLTINESFTVSATATDSSTGTATITCALQFHDHWMAPDTDGISLGITKSNTGFLNSVNDYDTELSFGAVKAVSTASALGNPTYIDCEIGEAYKIAAGGDIVSLNNLVSFGAKLPVLVPSSNAVSYENTITELKIVPRWWKI